MAMGTSNAILLLVFLLIGLGLTAFLLYLIIKALLKYIRTKDARDEKTAIKHSLGETLKTYRAEGKMTQEFVAEQIGVSRQAVSKWENGTSDPSTSNLLALAKLYGVSVEEFLRNIQ